MAQLSTDKQQTAPAARHCACRRHPAPLAQSHELRVHGDSEERRFARRIHRERSRRPTSVIKQRHRNPAVQRAVAVEVVVGHIQIAAPMHRIAHIDDIADKALCAGLTMDETGFLLRLQRGQ